MSIESKIFEDFGFKAAKEGFFKEWQSMTITVSNEQGIALEKAAEMTYLKLMNTK